ncbi:MAG TPA: bifunctional adenosylcobinamide kinase/adenosylcobinamide-phosphate guanylyltransferase [Polyangiales bacterium]
MSSRIILIGGGVRSGKSRFALQLAQRIGTRRCFVATAQAFDDEMRIRIEAHASERAGAFETVEVPHELAGALRSIVHADVVLIDCLTLWLSNLLLRGDAVSAIEQQVEELARVLCERRFHSVLVSNEVGMGIVPETPLGRAFRDIAGRTHQQLAPVADEIYFAMLGTMLRLRPEPVHAETPRESR